MFDSNIFKNTLSVYRQNQFPVLQNRVYSSAEEACNCVLGDIDIVQDLDSGLIFNAAFKSDLMVYDANYNSNPGFSGVFKKHLNWVAHTIEAHLGKQDLIEIGCGKGSFLELLLSLGFEITGFDSTYDGTNPKIIKKNFEPGIIKSPNQGLILRHVLEHILNPVNFLSEVKKSNGDQGLIYIEVPCFDWIMKNRTWFDIFYEHVNYFRLDDFRRMFGRVVKCGHCFGDQYLYVIADLSTLRQPKYNEACKLLFPDNFLMNLNSTQERLQRIEEKKDVAVWGGGSKGVIFSLLRERMGLPINMVIDINYSKQGKFLPVTGLKVYSPSQGMKILKDGATVYVMNSNYLAEIKEMTSHRFNYKEANQ